MTDAEQIHGDDRRRVEKASALRMKRIRWLLFAISLPTIVFLLAIEMGLLTAAGIGWSSPVITLFTASLLLIGNAILVFMAWGRIRRTQPWLLAASVLSAVLLVVGYMGFQATLDVPSQAPPYMHPRKAPPYMHPRNL